MPDKLRELYDNLRQQEPSFTIEWDTFRLDMQDENKLSQLHTNLSKKHEGFTVTYDDFKNDMLGGVEEKITPANPPQIQPPDLLKEFFPQTAATPQVDQTPAEEEIVAPVEGEEAQKPIPDTSVALPSKEFFNESTRYVAEASSTKMASQLDMDSLNKENREALKASKEKIQQELATQKLSTEKVLPESTKEQAEADVRVRNNLGGLGEATYDKAVQEWLDFTRVNNPNLYAQMEAQTGVKQEVPLAKRLLALPFGGAGLTAIALTAGGGKPINDKVKFDFYSRAISHGYNNLNKDIEILKARGIEDVAEQMGEFKLAFDKLGESFSEDGLSSQGKTIESEGLGIEKSAAHIEKRSADIDSAKQALEADPNATNEQIDAFNKDLGVFNTELDAFNKSNEAFGAKQSQYQAEITDYNNQLQTLQQSWDEFFTPEAEGMMEAYLGAINKSTELDSQKADLIADFPKLGDDLKTTEALNTVFQITKGRTKDLSGLLPKQRKQVEEQIDVLKEVNVSPHGIIAKNVLKKTWNAVVDFGIGLARVAKIPSDAISKEITGMGDEFSDSDRSLRAMENYVEANMKFNSVVDAPLLNTEEGGINFFAIPSIIAEQGTRMALMFASGGLATRGLAALGVGTKTAQIAGLAVGAGAAEYPSLIQDGLDKGLQGYDLVKYALPVSLAIGMAENMGIRGFNQGKVFSNAMVEDYIEKLAKATTKDFRKHVAKQSFIYISKATGEGLEEVVQGGMTKLNNSFANAHFRLSPEASFETNMVGEEVREEFAVGTLMGGLFGIGQVETKGRIRKGYLLEAHTNRDLFNEKAQELIDNGTVTTEQIAAVNEELDVLDTYLKKIPKNTPVERKMAAVDALIERDKLEAQKDGLDPAFGEKLDKEIEAKNKEAADAVSGNTAYLQRTWEGQVAQIEEAIDNLQDESILPALRAELKDARSVVKLLKDGASKKDIQARIDEITEGKVSEEEGTEPVVIDTVKDKEAKHAENIKGKFRKSFRGKNVTEDQIDGAIALMDARAEAWASEQAGRTPEQWYQRIADVKEGEFQEGTPRLYQLPDGTQAVGIPDTEATNGFYSPIEKRVTEFKQEKASVNKWKNIIGKGDEAVFTGVVDWLNTLKPDQTLSKAEINQFMKDNRIEVVEIQKGEDVLIPHPELTGEEKNRLAELDKLNSQYPNGAMEDVEPGGFNEYLMLLNRRDKSTTDELISLQKEAERKAQIAQKTQSKAVADKLWDESNLLTNRIEAIELSNEAREGQVVDQTKFATYQLPGEKENYKEVLVTMPSVVKELPNNYTTEKTAWDTYQIKDENGNVIAQNGGLAQATVDALAKINAERGSMSFISGHFSEPNILVHLRMNTRTDADGKKVLFIEEIQSDWGQVGRKQGFRGEPVQEQETLRILEEQHTKDEAELEEVVERMYEMGLNTGASSSEMESFELADQSFIASRNQEYRGLLKAKNETRSNDEFDAIAERLRNIEQKYKEVAQRRNELIDKRRGYEADLRVANRNLERQKDIGIPAAPFVTDTNAWVKLGFKVAMKEAVAQGADRIAWTTGEQQNERYDLSKQVESVLYENDGTLSAVRKGEDTYTLIKDGVSEDELADYVGKEAAEKLINQKRNDYGARTLRGVDLQVGGKGMTGFYGSPSEGKLGIVGNVAKKVAGQEPTTSEVKLESTIPTEDEDIIRTGKEITRLADAYDALNRGDRVYAVEKGKKAYRLDTVDDINDADKGDFKIVLRQDMENISQQHSIDVTQKLKAEVEKGQPLFQREGKAKPKGALETLENGKVIIHAMESPDFSTMVHEIIHIFEQDLTAEEISAVEEWSGKKQGTKAFSEAFARGGERYLREGKAPNEQLKAVFEKFKKWLTGIYKTLKGSPIEAKLSPEVKEIFDRLLAEQVTKPVTEQVTKPTETRKAELDQEISDILGRLGNIKSVAEENPFNNKDAFNEIVNLVRALAERGLIDIADGIDSIVKHLKGREDLKHFQRKHIDEIKDKLETELGTSPKASDKAPEGQRRRGVESNTFQAEDTPQQRTAKSIVDENPHYYQQMGFEMMKDKAHKLIDEGGGFESADVLLMLTTPGSTLDQDVTQSARALALHHFSTLMADKSVPEKVRANAFKSFLAVEDMFARVATKAGRGNAMIYMWKLLSPDGTLESVVRRTRQATEKKLGAKVKGTGKTRGELLEEATKDINEEVQGVIDGIIADGILDDILHIKIKNKQPKKRGKRVSSKEAIAKSKENLKALKDKYKSTKLTSSTVVPGLTQEAIEYAGGVAAEYAKIGYYKTADLIEKIRAYFSSEHKIKISDADIDKILSQKTENGKTIKQVSEEENKKAKIVEVVKDMESAIRDVVKGHWTKADEFGRDLKTKLMDEVGLTDAEAEIVAKPILEKVNEKVANTRSKAMEALIGKGRLPRAKREKKSITSKMIELINMGALTNEDLIAAFSKKFGLKQITKLEADTITRLATILQNASNQGIFEVLATKDLTKYIYELYPSSWWVEIADTWIALNYANMLFGFTTTILNSWSTGNNIMQKPFRDTVNLARWIRAAKRLKAGENPDIFNPFGEMAYGPMFQGMLYGVTSAKEVYKNGDFDDKYAELVTAQDKLRVPKLERNRFGRGKPYKPNFGFGPIKAFGRTFDLNIFNYAKYSNRNLIAQDKGMTETSYDMYLADAIRETLREETGLTGKALTKAVMAKITFKTFTPEVMEGLEAQLAEEVEQREKASKQEVSKEQKKIRMKELKREMLGLSEKEQAELDELARDNIFTGERYGFTGRLGRAVGRVINQNVGTAVLGKTWIPFTRVVANVTEFMLDHYPGPYGFMRANGWGITGMINRAANVIEPGREPSRTSQKGPVGSKAWYDQMGRASLGTASFILFASIGLGSDEDDWFQITGGYASEGYLKEGRKNVMPKYSIRIGHLDENKEKGISGRHLIIPYLNIPGLAIPLGLIGNANDRLNQGMDEESVMARMAVLFSLQNQWQTIAMVKDMNFVEGIERILTIVTDILKSDPESREAVMRKTGTAVAKNYINFLTRPSPHQNNAVRQIEKFFDPIQYSQKSIEEILAYSMSIQHFVNKPNVSIFGEDMKSYVGETLMPWPHWVGLRGNDDRWKFLAEYDAIPRRIFNQTFIIESDVIAGELEKRRLEPDELYVYSQTAGRKFNDLLGEYISSPYWYERGQTVEFYLKEDQVNGVKVDVNKLWAYAKEETRYDFGIRGGKIRSLDDIIDKPNFNYKTMEEILGLKK